MSEKSSPKILVIGGTSAYHLDLNKYGEVQDRFTISTDYGESSTILLLKTNNGQAVYFISRHGLSKLEFIPSSINYQANIEAARKMGVRYVFSWNGVGAINRLLCVNDLVIPSTLVDFTKTRKTTFNKQPAGRDSYEGKPFNEKARQILMTAARERQKRVFSGIYVCTEGPRLETKAEINMFAARKIDVVGMTLSPEAWLAGEAGMAYASLAIVTNLATGIEIPNRVKTNFSPSVGEKGMEICLDAALMVSKSTDSANKE